MQKKINSHIWIGGILGVAVLVGVISIGMLVPTAPPNLAYVTDVTPNSATIVWQTNKKVHGRVLVAKRDNWNPRVGYWMKMILGAFPGIEGSEDEFSSNGQLSSIHKTEVKGLQPDKTYNFVIANGAQLYKVAHLQIKTKAMKNTPPSLMVASGQVKGNSKGVANALVLISKKTEPAVKVSAVTDNSGMWVANIGDLKVASNDQLVVEAFTPEGSHKKAISQPGFFNPTVVISFNK